MSHENKTDQERESPPARLVEVLASLIDAAEGSFSGVIHKLA